MAKTQKKSGKVGEGNREADQHYRKKTQDFVQSGKVKDAAKNAGRQDEKEGREAEEKGRERAKEFDPAVKRDYEKGQKV
jgi:hypothetical protein